MDILGQGKFRRTRFRLNQGRATRVVSRFDRCALATVASLAGAGTQIRTADLLITNQLLCLTELFRQRTTANFNLILLRLRGDVTNDRVLFV